jgi:hypothetical protein
MKNKSIDGGFIILKTPCPVSHICICAIRTYHEIRRVTKPLLFPHEGLSALACNSASKLQCNKFVQ